MGFEVVYVADSSIESILGLLPKDIGLVIMSQIEKL
jgi:hypothetical protein